MDGLHAVLGAHACELPIPEQGLLVHEPAQAVAGLTGELARIVSIGVMLLASNNLVTITWTPLVHKSTLLTSSRAWIAYMTHGTFSRWWCVSTRASWEHTTRILWMRAMPLPFSVYAASMLPVAES